MKSQIKEKELFWKNKIESVLKDLEHKATIQQTFEINARKQQEEILQQNLLLKKSKSKLKRSCIKQLKESNAV